MFKGNRTRLLGTLIMILGVIELYAREIFPPEWQGYVLVTIGIAVIILRQLTTTPPGRKHPPDDPEDLSGAM